MKFVDCVELTVKSGNGGPGAVGWRREKFVPKGGPDGGDGGDGGDVLFVASRKPQTLMDLSLKRIYKAQNGHPGGPKKMYGLRGKNAVLEVPVGTIVFENDTLIVDLTAEGQTFLAASGGKGGKGNARFATSVNQAPRYAQPGLPGEERRLRLELRMIAEVGLVGLPNAGKSTLLQALTRAHPKIAAYPFTTLYPNLGILRFYDSELVVADIPGLIEGASQGHGLGFEFLRHISRTRVLVHLIDASQGDADECWKNFEIVKNEIEASPYDLKNKPSIVALTKIDIMDPTQVENIRSYFNRKGISSFEISAATGSGLAALGQAIHDQKEAHSH